MALSGISWSILFPFGVWCLWLRRNGVIFREAAFQKSLKEETLAKAFEFAFLGLNEKLQCTLAVIQVQWYLPPSPPHDNWFKLNSDGSSLGNPSRVGGGGIIRNSRGEWVSGYAHAIGHTSSVAAELWALRDGLNLCSALNLTNVIFELDAKLVVNLVQKGSDGPSGNDVIIADNIEGLQKIPRTRVQHCYREANKCADALARRGALLPQDFVIFHFPPTNVALLINLDATGTVYKRRHSSFAIC